MRTSQARSSSSLRALASKSIGCRWRTCSNARQRARRRAGWASRGVRSSGWLGLEVAQLVHQRVVLGVRDLRVVEDVVAVVVLIELLAQLLARCRPRAHPSPGRRLASAASKSKPTRSSISPPVGQLEVQRGHGDAPVGDRGEVGAVLLVVARVVAVDPVAPAPALPPPPAPAGRGRCACRGGRPDTPAPPAGSSMLRSVPSGIGTSSSSSTIRGRTSGDLVEVRRSHRCPAGSPPAAAACCETAIAGMPSTMPSSAAATVPE